MTKLVLIRGLAYESNTIINREKNGLVSVQRDEIMETCSTEQFSCTRFGMGSLEIVQQTEL